MATYCLLSTGEGAGLIALQVETSELNEAMNVTKEFDDQKTYDKLECHNNWLGFLGEQKFNSWLDSKAVPHVWNKFVKKGWDDADFVVNNQTIDVKTTFDTSLWFQKPKFDVYVFSRMNEESKDKLYLIGWVTKAELITLVLAGEAQIVQREFDGVKRLDYCVGVDELHNMSGLLSYLSASKQDSMTENNMKTCEQCEGKFVEKGDWQKVCVQCFVENKNKVVQAGQKPQVQTLKFQGNPDKENRMVRMNALNNSMALYTGLVESKLTGPAEMTVAVQTVKSLAKEFIRFIETGE